MSTYMQLIVEVTTGDDLVLDPLQRGETVTLVLNDDETVMATVHSVAYIPEEALE